MARPPTGSVLTTKLADGTCSYRLRFRAQGRRQDLTLHERGACECGCGGGWDERGARTELGNVLARIRAGVWEPPRPPERAPAPTEVPTFHEYASGWLQGKRDGTIGDKALAASTLSGYSGILSHHLLPFFARHRLDQIDRQLCLSFKAYKVREAMELREALAAGAGIRDYRGRGRVPLSASSVRSLIATLAAILDEAVEG